MQVYTRLPTILAPFQQRFSLGRTDIYAAFVGPLVYNKSPTFYKMFNRSKEVVYRNSEIWNVYTLFLQTRNLNFPWFLQCDRLYMMGSLYCAIINNISFDKKPQRTKCPQIIVAINQVKLDRYPHDLAYELWKVLLALISHRI